MQKIYFIFQLKHLTLSYENIEGYKSIFSQSVTTSESFNF